MLSVEDCHWYVRLPVPVAVVFTAKAAGSPPEQIVWLDEIAPGVTLLMDIVIAGVKALQETPFNELLISNW